MKKNALIKLLCTAAVITFTSQATAEHQSYDLQINSLHIRKESEQTEKNNISGVNLSRLYEKIQEEQTIRKNKVQPQEDIQPPKKVQFQKKSKNIKKIASKKVIQPKKIYKEKKIKKSQKHRQYQEEPEYPEYQNQQEPQHQQKISRPSYQEHKQRQQQQQEYQKYMRYKKLQEYEEQQEYQKYTKYKEYKDYQNYQDFQKYKMDDKLYMCANLGYTFSTKKIDSENYTNNLKGAMLAGGGFGYTASDMFRSDILASYRGQYKYSGRNDQNQWGQQNFSSIAVMINGYFSPKSFDYVKPYLMAGIGIAINRAGDFVGESDTGSVRIIGDQQNNFAWQVGAGILIEITKRANVDFEYKYVNLGYVTTKGIFGREDCYGGTAAFKGRFSVHEVLIGVSYSF